MSKKIYYATCSHPFAELLVAQDSQGVCAVLLGDHQHDLITDLQSRFSEDEIIEDKALLQKNLQRVTDFLTRPDHPLKLKLSLHGTDFQKRVWHVLEKIPIGTTVSYSQIAEQIGQPTAMRAVAGACAKNPVALAVACHRVLRSDGGISGYRWGVERKRKLIALEKKYATDAAHS